MKEIEIFTDGSCLGNPGQGGVGIVLRYGDKEKNISEGYLKTTNNRMELRAVITALSALKESCSIQLYSDSQYVKNGITQWIFNWRKNNWRTADKKPVKNKDLWIVLDDLVQNKGHKIQWNWVKGHDGHRENEMCDELAKNGANNPNLIDEGYEG